MQKKISGYADCIATWSNVRRAKDESVSLWEVAGGQGWPIIYIFFTLHDV